MNPNDIAGQLPHQLREGPRAYFIAGWLGVVLFVSSGLLWGPNGTFVGALLLELGGGAFIVFLLEFLLPRALRYADDATWHVPLARIDIAWSDQATEALVTDYSDAEVETLLRRCRRRAAFPTKGKVSSGVFDTGGRVGEHCILSQQVGADFLLYYYAERRGRPGRKTVFIADIRRVQAPPGEESGGEPGPM
ncbi:MAG TPA: hypothetical protein VIY28_12730 [Pseudonocardiaceae bacterium]